MTTPAQEALSFVKVSLDGLPIDQPFRRYTIAKRRVKKRNALIMTTFLKSDNKPATLKDLSERFGLTENRLLKIVERINRGELSVDAEMAVRIQALREVKRTEIISDNDQHRAFLDTRIAELEKMKANNEQWAEVEQTDGTGKDAEGTTTKKKPINQLLKETYAELSKTYVTEADALALYVPKPDQRHVLDGTVTHKLQASADFVYEFDRVEKMHKEIPANAEVVSDN